MNSFKMLRIIILTVLFFIVSVAGTTATAQFEREALPNPRMIGSSKWRSEHGKWQLSAVGKAKQPGTEQLNYKIRFGDFGTKTGRQGQVAELKELDGMKRPLELWHSHPGAPLVPVKSVSLVIPGGRQVASISVAPGLATVVGGAHDLEPAEEALPVGTSPVSTGTSRDKQIYESDELYPSIPAGEAVLEQKGGINILTLNLFPLAYRPATGRLLLYRELSISLELSPAARPAAAAPADTLSEVSALVSNPEELDSYAGGISGETPAASADYLIVTSAALRPAFEALRDQKAARGLTASIATLEEDILPNFNGTETGDTADKIRDFLRSAYNNWGTRWVLLGGDTEIIPKRGVYVSSGSYNDTSLPTDSYYACLDGPWNNDHDTIWGEYNDGLNGGDIDKLEELYIGRAPVSNLTEASAFVAKTIAYETTNHPNRLKVVMLGEKLDDFTYGSYSAIPIIEESFASGWEITELYDSTGGWTRADFTAELNSAPHLVNHLGHANYDYNARLYTSTVRDLTNSAPYFMYSQGCLSGGFDARDIAISEQHVIGAHGAFAVIMNARYGWYAPGSYPSYSHRYAKAFWNAVMNEGKVHLAEANRRSKEANIAYVGATGTYRWIHFELNLLGDPETSFQLADSADGDADGIPDETDCAPEDPDRWQDRAYADADSDGVRDSASLSVIACCGNELPSGYTLSLNGPDNCPGVYNPDQQDLDHDGTGNACDSDSDGDGAADTDDCAPLDAGKWRNQACGDADADGVRNDETLSIVPCFGSIPPSGYTAAAGAIDNCPADYNPLQQDSDKDGVGDACDTDDSDGDGVKDNQDCAPIDALLWQDRAYPDADDDGVRDAALLAAAPCFGSSLPAGFTLADNGPDNCSTTPNAGQEDLDSDGAGDACDDDRDGDSIADASDCAPADDSAWRELAYSDSDGDGVRDSLDLTVAACFGASAPDGYTTAENGPDNCPSIANSNQRDSDGDGLGDLCDSGKDRKRPRIRRITIRQKGARSGVITIGKEFILTAVTNPDAGSGTSALSFLFDGKKCPNAREWTAESGKRLQLSGRLTIPAGYASTFTVQAEGESAAATVKLRAGRTNRYQRAAKRLSGIGGQDDLLAAACDNVIKQLSR